MKNYNEIAENLFERRDEYEKKQTAKKAKNKKRMTLAVSVFAFALIGLGVWKGEALMSKEKPSAVQFEAKEKKTEIIEKTNNGEPLTKKVDNNSSQPVDENANKNETKAEKTEEKEKNESSEAKTEVPEAEEQKGKVYNSNVKSNDKDIISSYYGDYEMPCYITPENGTYILSLPVRYSIERYGSTKRYLVFIDFFKDRDSISDEEKTAEFDRLKKAGCDIRTLTLWTYEGADEKKVYYTQVCAVLTKEQIETLFTGREYGYFLEFPTNGDSSAPDEVHN